MGRLPLVESVEQRDSWLSSGRCKSRRRPGCVGGCYDSPVFHFVLDEKAIFRNFRPAVVKPLPAHPAGRSNPKHFRANAEFACVPNLQRLAFIKAKDEMLGRSSELCRYNCVDVVVWLAEEIAPYGERTALQIRKRIRNGRRSFTRSAHATNIREAFGRVPRSNSPAPKSRSVWIGFAVSRTQIRPAVQTDWLSCFVQKLVELLAHITQLMH
jgi:hypothetical protein